MTSGRCDAGARRLCIHYVANVRLPSERANACQIFAQCDALAARGHEVRLIAPRRRNRFSLGDGEIASYYGLRAAPRLTRLFTVDLIEAFPPRLQRLPFVLQALTFAWAARRCLRQEGAAVVYTRDPWALFLLARERSAPWRLFYEAHDLPERAGQRQRLLGALGRSAGVVAITRGLRADLVAGGARAADIEVLEDGFDPARFAALPDKGAARARLALDPARPLAVYAGHLFAWKGADTLVRAAALSARFDVLLVGGRPEDRRRVEAVARGLKAANVRLVPPVEPGKVPLFLAAADVLVLPNSGRQAISARYTSPFKLFEYMAAGRPIVASDLPSLREVLDESTALFVAPDDPGALRQGIERCLDDREAAAAAARRARERVQRYAWDARAERLERFLCARVAGGEGRP
ncbi:MAG: glycosyltransferase [Planctomycetes bacterium]|nr:glycosyltransferase [Planctomycetota bacterium]